ncbi:hypothetical protein AUJ59_02790 [Candidatus Beckwithbacteria bacterium CG1_02_47_37]|uniref:Uncharacterized protein n=2 Tax=Candidatus Beckwithiibacteriota TaxID=1752726 RepID=A0A1J4RQ57_9BACT|nr:MAG: hypothetical protein AUJ59_02790 [Candidatus Beckwithbacteria bacterium CG1_02_47_37]PJC66683.1 MAG: hypothetical protein CO018_00715 [Candidatus Beckwithbacteria bacterium CG_4_9_14_0_2_um_filter_47_11]
MSQLALNLGDYLIDENFSNFPGLENKRGGWLFGTGKTPAQIIEAILPFVFVIAGLILFVMFIFGGFTIFVSAGSPEKMKQGQGMIVNALIGFLVIFAAYWIIQILETTLGFKITA